jgi:hypothetical protein
MQNQTVAISTTGSLPLNSQVQVTGQLSKSSTAIVVHGTPYVSSLFANRGMTSITGRCYADQAGTLTFQTSDDGITWDTLGTHAVGASTIAPFTDTPNGAIMRYTFDTTSGNTTVFRLSVYALGVHS